MKQKITTFLWFDGQAAEAAKFYVSLFKGSKITSSSPMMTTFRLAGQDFMALNGGPHYKFTPAISLYVSCKTQREIDRLTAKLTEGGQQQPCGWVSDRYGLSWQIIPDYLGEAMGGKDRAKAQRVFAAMMKMKKLDIAELKRAAAGKAGD